MNHTSVATSATAPRVSMEMSVSRWSAVVLKCQTCVSMEVSCVPRTSPIGHADHFKCAGLR